MKEKLTIPAVSQDKNKMLSSRAEMRERLIASIPLKQSDDKRAAAVYLLESRKLVRDVGELQDVLGCSGKQIQQARERAAQALTSDDDLGKYIQSRMAETGAPAAPAKPTEAVKENESAGERLVRVARKVFEVDAEGITGRERKTRQRFVNWAVVLIAQRSLHESRAEAAVIAGVGEDSADHMLTDGREEYAARGYFYNQIDKICKELGIHAPL